MTPTPSQPCAQVMDLINATTEGLETIARLSELGRAIDGDPQFFVNLVELMSLIEERCGHLSRLIDQLATCVLPRPHAVEEQP